MKTKMISFMFYTSHKGVQYRVTKYFNEKGSRCMEQFEFWDKKERRFKGVPTFKDKNMEICRKLVKRCVDTRYMRWVDNELRLIKTW